MLINGPHRGYGFKAGDVVPNKDPGEGHDLERTYWQGMWSSYTPDSREFNGMWFVLPNADYGVWSGRRNAHAGVAFTLHFQGTVT